jgi:biopolymer transport protein ExbB
MKAGMTNPALSIFAACLLLCCAMGAGQVQAQSGSNEADELTLEGLLEAVREGRTRDRASDRERVRRFLDQQSERENMLRDIRARRAELEQTSSEMEAQYEENERNITDLEVRLQERMGSLKELFGVLQQVASDTEGQFHVSLTELEHPERSKFLIDFAGRMGQANRLPAIAEIERLWFELQREMTESGKVITRRMPVVNSEGSETSLPVTRIGLFNAVAEGEYLQYIPETGRLVAFSRQPGSRYLAGPQALAEGEDKVVPVAIDPVRGQLLEILTQAPNLRERIDQGGAIGYTIIALGVAGALLAIVRLLILYNETRVIHRQLRNTETPRPDNAVGRIILAAREEDSPDAEMLELRLGEAVLAEVPRINRFLPLMKIIAAVAPLMGLLGTVTGMIVTFQAITLFGAGDPRLMAGGISQALITTVLGLCVAIPMLLLHNLVQGRARGIIELLQQRAVALVAARAEATHTHHGGGTAA